VAVASVSGECGPGDRLDKREGGALSSTEGGVHGVNVPDALLGRS
jgi:hypothetical protein